MIFYHDEAGPVSGAILFLRSRPRMKVRGREHKNNERSVYPYPFHQIPPLTSHHLHHIITDHTHYFHSPNPLLPLFVTNVMVYIVR